MATIEKLLAVQAELKAPKGQYNSFGKYKYRSCEDILEAVKPLLKKHGASITISDELVQIGNRIYVKATATFWNADGTGGVNIENTAFAREPDTKKGMDDSQVTGTASSYARKYALNGLLLIDDTKDADTDENRNERENRAKKQKEQPKQEPVEDRTGEPAYPTEESMVKDLMAVANKSEKVNGMLTKLLETNNARDLAELAFMKPDIVKAWWQKLCQR